MTIIETLRKPRLFGVAMFDVTMSVIILLWLAQRYKIDPSLFLAIGFFVGYLMHKWFQVDRPYSVQWG